MCIRDSYVRDLYDETYGRKSHEIGVVQHRDYPWLGGSPDGITEDGLLIEIKCPLTRKIEPKVPKHYLPQIQLLLEIMDLEECDFIQFKPEPREFVVVRVKRDREWFAKYLPVMKSVWDRIVLGRQRGLCEIVSETDHIKKKVVCEIVDDVQAQAQDAKVPCV